jgi:hypothetical protein
MNIWLKPDWDRGYEKGREAGIVEEQARIIKLLEQETDIIYEFAYAIELIKGEK